MLLAVCNAKYEMLQGKDNNREHIWCCNIKVSDISKPIIANTEKVILITRSVVALHNFVMKKCGSQSENYIYCPPSYVDQESPSGVVPGDWRKEEAVCDGLLSIEKLGSNNYSRTEKKVRDRFKNYFCSPE